MRSKKKESVLLSPPRRRRYRGFRVESQVRALTAKRACVCMWVCVLRCKWNLAGRQPLRSPTLFPGAVYTYAPSPRAISRLLASFVPFLILLVHFVSLSFRCLCVHALCKLGRIQFPRYVNACSLFITAHWRAGRASAFLFVRTDKAVRETFVSEINKAFSFLNRTKPKPSDGAVYIASSGPSRNRRVLAEGLVCVPKWL